MKKKIKIPIEIIWLIVIACVIFLAAGIGYIAANAKKPHTEPFNHELCKYPLRTTNPIDGCDNTDPCDAASAAKGSSGACV